MTTRIKGGIAEFNGDGSTTIFSIEHGEGKIPVVCLIGKAERDLADIDYWKADEYYIHVVFKTPPPPGDRNVKIWWLAIYW